MGSDVEKRSKGGGLRLVEGAALVAVGVVGVLIAISVVGFVLHVLWDLIGIIVVVAVVGLVLHLFLRNRRS